MITPTGRNILVKLDTVQKIGIIHVPEKAGVEKKYVITVAVGPTIEGKIQIGDLLIIRPGTSAVECEDRGQKFLIVHETDVVAVRS